MSTAEPRATRSVEDLSAADRKRLEEAHRRLREATHRYEQFLGTELVPDREVPVHDASAMAAAQADLQKAEDELWRLREQLLGWARPPWAPRASLVSDWFSEEDRIYDNRT